MQATQPQGGAAPSNGYTCDGPRSRIPAAADAPAAGDIPHMMALYPQTLVVKERVLDNFDINLMDGRALMRVDAKLLSFHGRKSLFDPNGNCLFDIIKKPFHIHTTFAIEDQSGRALMEVRNNLTLLGSKAKATFTSTSTGLPVSLVMKGNFLDTSAEIVDENTGATVARIDRKLFNLSEAFLGLQTYHLTVAPGVDMALLVAMCICLDEKNNEGQEACSVM